MLGGLVALGATLPAAGLAIVPSFVRRRTRAIDLGPISAFPEGEFTAVTFLTDPAAGEISRRAAYVRNNGLLGTEPSFTIMSSRCTHVGCPTQPNGPLFRAGSAVANAAGREDRADPPVRLRLPVPRQPVRHGRQPDGRPRTARARSVRVLDPQRAAHLGKLFSVSRVDGAGSDARIHGYRPPRRRAAGQRCGVVAVSARTDGLTPPARLC